MDPPAVDDKIGRTDWCIIQTRQKLKEAYDAEFTATIERAEKQIILAKHGRRLLQLLDDSPVVPGDTRRAYEGTAQARQILNDAEEDLRDWQHEPEPDSYIENPANRDRTREAPGLLDESGSVATGDAKPAPAAGTAVIDNSEGVV